MRLFVHIYGAKREAFDLTAVPGRRDGRSLSILRHWRFQKPGIGVAHHKGRLDALFVINSGQMTGLNQRCL
jgi:hypothetical protein